MTIAFKLPPEIDTREASEAGRWCAILNPSNHKPVMSGGVPVRFLVCGVDSAAYRRGERAARAAVLELRQSNPGVEQDALEMAFRLELLSHLVPQWEGVIDPSGGAIECNAANVRALFEIAPVYRAQVELFLESRANFTAASATA